MTESPEHDYDVNQPANSEGTQGAWSPEDMPPEQPIEGPLLGDPATRWNTAWSPSTNQLSTWDPGAPSNTEWSPVMPPDPSSED